MRWPRLGWVGAWDGCLAHAAASNDPIGGCVCRQGRTGWGLRGRARLAVVAEREVRTVRNDPIGGYADRPGRDGCTLREVGRPMVVAEGETRTVRNDPIRGCAGRLGWGPCGTAWVAVVAGRGMRMARNDPIGGYGVGRVGMVRGRARTRHERGDGGGPMVGARANAFLCDSAASIAARPVAVADSRPCSVAP